MGIDTKANAWEPVRGRSALEVGDVCLFKDGSERGGALVSDVVVKETARDGWGQCMREQARVNGR